MSEYRSDQVLIKVPQPVKRLEILRFLDAVIGDQRLSGHSVALRIVTRVCSFLMKANDGLRGIFIWSADRTGVYSRPPLCLCCGPNMICTCLLLCFLPWWAWPALSGGLCQHGDVYRAVKCSIPAQNSSINSFFMSWWSFIFASEAGSRW